MSLFMMVGKVPLVFPCTFIFFVFLPPSIWERLFIKVNVCCWGYISNCPSLSYPRAVYSLRTHIVSSHWLSSSFKTALPHVYTLHEHWRWISMLSNWYYHFCTTRCMRQLDANFRHISSLHKFSVTSMHGHGHATLSLCCELATEHADCRAGCMALFLLWN